MSFSSKSVFFNYKECLFNFPLLIVNILMDKPER